MLNIRLILFSLPQSSLGFGFGLVFGFVLDLVKIFRIYFFILVSGFSLRFEVRGFDFWF